MANFKRREKSHENPMGRSATFSQLSSRWLARAEVYLPLLTSLAWPRALSGCAAPEGDLSWLYIVVYLEGVMGFCSSLLPPPASQSKNQHWQQISTYKGGGGGSGGGQWKCVRHDPDIYRFFFHCLNVYHVHGKHLHFPFSLISLYLLLGQAMFVFISFHYSVARRQSYFKQSTSTVNKVF